jgi:hypothetical protein
MNIAALRNLTPLLLRRGRKSATVAPAASVAMWPT